MAQQGFSRILRSFPCDVRELDPQLPGALAIASGLVHRIACQCPALCIEKCITGVPTSDQWCLADVNVMSS